MQPEEKIIKCYDAIAANYATERIDEIYKKHLHRVLDKNGQFLFSFHVGKDIVHFDKAGNVGVNIDLYFFQTDKIIELLNDAGFEIIDALERLPYKNIE